jgi:hypothetical protein
LPEVPTDTTPKISAADTTMKSIRLSNDGEIVEDDSDFDLLVIYNDNDMANYVGITAAANMLQ